MAEVEQLRGGRPYTQHWFLLRVYQSDYRPSVRINSVLFKGL